MADQIAEEIKKEKILQTTLAVAKKSGIDAELIIHKLSVTKGKKEMQPDLEEALQKIRAALINQKLELMPLKKKFLKRVLKLARVDENFYYQLKALLAAEKMENEGLLALEKIMGEKQTEVREDVWGTVLKHLELRELEVRGGQKKGGGVETEGGEKAEQ